MKNKILKLALMLVVSCFSSIALTQVTSILGICDVTFDIGNNVTLCSSSSFYGLPAGSPAGGTYSGTGVLDNFFLANLAGPGEHIITYTYDNGVCSGTASDTITVVTPIPLILEGDMELCFGESTVITALNGEDIEWESGSNATSETHQPDETTNYSVYGFDVNGCLTAAGYTIIVHPLPLVEISGDTSLCLGETSVLTANGAMDYVWSDSSTDETLLAENLTDQQYALTGTDEFGCVNQDITTVTVHGYPDVTATEIVYGCPGEELLLQADGALTYQWSVGGDLSFVYITPSISQTISVVGTNEFGCSDEATSQVEVYPVPVFEITGDFQICLGEVTELLATGDYSYVWSNGGLENSITVSPESTTLYLATAQNEFGCQSTDDVMLIVYDLPEVIVSGDTEICLGSETTLAATGALDYIWSNGSLENTITISPISSANISVTGFDIHECSTTLSFDVIVHELPSVEISGANEVCAGSQNEYSVSGTDNYIWDNDAVGNTVTRLIDESQIISVNAENEFGCSSFAELLITALELPVIEVSGDVEICEGDSTVITATGATEYLWFDESTADTHGFLGTASQEYWVTGTAENGCSNSLNFVITVLESLATSIDADPLNDLCIGDEVMLNDPNYEVSVWQTPLGIIEADTLIWEVTSVSEEISMRSLGANGCFTEWISQQIEALSGPQITLSGDLEICTGETTTLTVTGSDNYIWSTEETIDSVVVSPADTTMYSVSSFNGTCTTTLEVMVNVTPIPELTASGDFEICFGDSSLVLIEGASTYVWNDEQEGSELMLAPLETTSYTVIGFNSDACSSEISFTISVDSLPEVMISGLDNPVCYGQDITLTASGAETYVWSNDFGGPTVLLVPTADAEIGVTGTDNNGCSNMVFVQIDVTDLVELTFELADTLCLEDGVVVLSASPAGGVFTGDGVQNTNEFNPNDVALFTNVILTYSYADEFGCESTDTEEVYVEICDGIEENLLNTFEIYPNPAHEMIQFKSSDLIVSFFIYDVQGKVILSRDHCQSFLLVEDISQLCIGLYTVEIKTASGFSYRRPFMVD